MQPQLSLQKLPGESLESILAKEQLSSHFDRCWEDVPPAGASQGEV